MKGGTRGRFRLTVIFSLITLATLTLTLLIVSALVGLTMASGLWRYGNRPALYVAVGLVSIVVGTLFSHFVSRHQIKSIQSLIEASRQVAKGNFDVHIDEDDMPIEEMRALAENFNVMVGELKGGELLQNDFIANVSHEFKTPLAAVEGYATLLQTPGLDEGRRKEYTDRILAASRRLSSLAGNILLLSKVENSGLGLHKEKYSLDEQLRQAILECEGEWSARKQEMDIDLDEVEFTGQKELMFHVWTNIIGNAVKYSPDYGIIRISLRCEGKAVTVQIGDNGIGMDEEVQSHIFEKFYQASSSRSGQGNGLGLALAKRIVDLHDGSIGVESRPGMGSTFTVTLPLT